MKVFKNLETHYTLQTKSYVRFSDEKDDSNYQANEENHIPPYIVAELDQILHQL
ncbi:hypothetical protein LINPERPRIM_LOCUS6555 [Linum perenne]